MYVLDSVGSKLPLKKITEHRLVQRRRTDKGSAFGIELKRNPKKVLRVKLNVTVTLVNMTGVKSVTTLLELFQ